MNFEQALFPDYAGHINTQNASHKRVTHRLHLGFSLIGLSGIDALTCGRQLAYNLQINFTIQSMGT